MQSESRCLASYQGVPVGFGKEPGREIVGIAVHLHRSVGDPSVENMYGDGFVTHYRGIQEMAVCEYRDGLPRERVCAYAYDEISFPAFGVCRLAFQCGEILFELVSDGSHGGTVRSGRIAVGSCHRVASGPCLRIAVRNVRIQGMVRTVQG